MRVRYDKLWRKMKDNKMKKKDLASAAGISLSTITKMANEEFVSMEIIARMCKIFHCDIGEIVEIIDD